jgi:hypothetical protein
MKGIFTLRKIITLQDVVASICNPRHSESISKAKFKQKGWRKDSSGRVIAKHA